MIADFVCLTYACRPIITDAAIVIVRLLYGNHLDTASAAVVPYEADIRRIHACSDEHVEVLMRDDFQLFNNIAIILAHDQSLALTLWPSGRPLTCGHLVLRSRP